MTALLAFDYPMIIKTYQSYGFYQLNDKNLMLILIHI